MLDLPNGIYRVHKGIYRNLIVPNSAIYNLFYVTLQVLKRNT
ncbi:hypothetical protein HMPREF9441_01760 [Paraprevotella clara YIT 11840]|uniref:Uncharacterized protein n=1 Tax=Paraprevotella clara YIT 11840 TaxID=762968 RepID=G5SQX0_9BACT|nr:hypothetical protein HMPREF9441_01760 [Paraprevotella clara YIT 11840]